MTCQVALMPIRQVQQVRGQRQMRELFYQMAREGLAGADP